MKMWVKTLLAITVLLFTLVGCSNEESVKEQEIEKREEQVEEVDKVEKSEEFSENKDDAELDEDFKLEQELEYYFDYEDLDEALTEFEYLNIIQKTIKIFTTAVENADTYIEKAIEDPSLLKDESWINDYAFTFFPISLLADLMEKMEEDGSVPDNMLDIHAKVKKSLSLMDEAGETLVEAIKDDMNTEKYDEGVELMKKSANAMDEVVEIIDEKSQK